MTAPRPREQRRPSSPPDTLPPRRGGRSSPCTYAASAAGRPAGPARVRGARRGFVRRTRALVPAALLALSGALALPATAQAQEISLVSNIGQGHNTNLNINPPDFEQFGVEIGENRGAQRFTTGPNEAGYTLQSVVLNLHTNRGTGSVVQVAIHDNASSGNPGTLLAVLDNPADPIGNNAGTAGNRTFSAPNPLSLDADTRYWVMVSNTTTNNETNFDVSLTNSNNETSAHGFSIRNSRHQGTPGAWLESSTSQQRMEIRGTVVIPPGLEVTLHLSDDAPFEDLLAVTVTATASPASPVAFTVEISASPVAPATDDDFELSTNRTLSFAANATGSTGTVRISPVADEDPEPHDVVTVSGVVSNPAIPNPDDVRLTILNDDADLPQDIAIDAPAAVDEGAGTVDVTVTMTTRQNTAPVIDAQLFYRQRPGTATRGDDYTRPQGLGNRIAIVPISEFSANADGTAWVARHSFEIGIVDDGEAEADETIVFEIYDISDNRGTEQTIVIRDDDRPPAVSIAAANPTVLEEQPAVFTLSRTGATGSALTVTVALTEQADRDVLPDGAATERTVTFARGSSTAALTVELKDDSLAEPDGDLTAAVRAGDGYTVGDPSTATVTVVDDDGVPVIEGIEVVSTPRLVSRGAREADTYGEGETIRIGVRFNQPVHVEGEPTFALVVGDPCGAVCEARYESGSGTDTLVFAYLVLEVDIDRNGIAIPANPIEVVYGDSIRSDSDHEARLSYRRKGTQRGHKTDGSRTAAPHLSAEDAEAHEADGEMAFTVRLEPHGLGIVTVDYATRDGSGDTGAVAGEDYTETSGTLRFNPLETERTVTVPIIDDAHEDDGETFTLRLSNPDGARLRSGDREATGTIRNSDPEAAAIPGPGGPEAAPLTASFEAMPGEHDGARAFTFRIAFTEPLSWMNGSPAVAGGRRGGGRGPGDVGQPGEPAPGPVAADGGAGLAGGRDGDARGRGGGRTCDTPAAVCTKDGRALSTTIATTVAGPPAAPLTASFEGVPAEHDGERAFTFRIAFSERVGWMNGRRLREHVVAVAGGRATSASRVNRRRDLWQVTVEPDSLAAVTVTLAAGAACRTPAAVCTSDGRALSDTIATTVRGPVAVSVADARAEEGTDATLDFAVSLSRAASGPVAVAYATADGTATAGADYTARKGQLTFAPGETAKTVRVPVLDDAHDEGEETLTLRLSAASGAVLADGTATGTIVNSDKLQQAWLARFGRTVATHVTDAVGDRLRGTPGQESHLTVGGYRLPLGQRGAAGKPEAGGATPEAEADTDSSSLEALVTGLAGVLGLGPGQAGGTGVDPGGGGLGWDAWPDAGRDPRLGQSQSVNLDLRRLLLGSSFRLSLGATDDAGSSCPRLTAWGRVAGTTFDGRDGDDLSLNGDVLTGTVGVDGEWDRLLAGLAVAHSRGDGSYTMPVAGGDDSGNLEQTLTSIHPYLRYAVNDRLDVWGLFGYGWGELDLEMDDGMTIETDTNLVMGAFGGRGILLSAAESGGFQLATRTDAMLTRTTSDKVAEMESAEADAHRLRLVLEGSRGFAWAEGRSLTPTMEVGLRHDWGDAETGFGLELGGRVQYADPALGLTIDATVRGLLAHEDRDYQEWGASGTVRIAPGAMGQGLSLTLAPAWGATASGVDGLWSRQTTAGLAPQGTRQTPAGRLNAEVGYGFAPFDTGLLTPYAGTVLSDGAARTYRVGTRLQLNGPGATGLTLNLEGMRQEPAGQQPVNQGLRLQITWGF